MSAAHAVVDLDVTGDTISRHLYGHFAEHLGRCIYGGFWVGEDSDIPNVRGIRSDVVDALRALRVPNLRWPGGCFADEYHWRDGVGPRAERPTMVNTHWGDVVEDNAFGTHEFMDLCEMLGADAYVNGNVGSGTVQEMSEWVEYLTRSGDSPMARLRRANGRDEPWQVAFWGLGNEAWGCGGHMTPDYYTSLARRYATFCRDHDGNRLTRIAAGAADADLRWTHALMASAVSSNTPDPQASPYQAISFHYYTHSGTGIQRESATEFDAEQYYRTLAHAAGVERVISAHEAVMDAYDPERRIGLVCDEWGTWWRVEPGTNPGFLFQQNTVRDALVAGLHFDAFHRHAGRLRMANIAQTLNVLQAMILTDDEGGLVLTPTYHVYEMNVGHHDAASAPSHVVRSPAATVGDEELPLLSLSASTRGATALLSLTHSGIEGPLPVTVDLRGRRAVVARARVLTGPDAQAHNTPEAPDAVAPAPLDAEVGADGVLRLTLPAHAFATVELTLE
ncbi:alpha-N-arabinofuranosidase [Microbacterium sp. T2.11-28]|uniref:alpha-N-arabinofuranosidase n=1 Tax=unclassified Microbacterium TaxID=2609290 RepID=UPI00247764AC|nr:alpha-L-arabinofuranosidase C-terminal domain-containing protein [Microbacterium sp. T2.11-28]CAI9390394.1 Intracellular exo-alpha-L-arabinofuranosidase 2 [Microbacterium sp. T2.11-28]